MALSEQFETNGIRSRVAAVIGRLVFPGLSGLTILIAAAVVAIAIERSVGLSGALIALLAGFLLKLSLDAARSPAASDALAAGSNTATKSILRVGVALLGFRLSFDQITELGLLPVILSFLVVILTLLLGTYLGRRLGLSTDTAIIASGATAICGASAALAITSAFSKCEKRDGQTVVTILIVTLLSSAAMLLYPAFAHLVGLNHLQAGLLFGATIHDVAQVVGAGLLYGDGATEAAAYTKMLRVALLAPAVVAIIVIARNTDLPSAERQTCSGIWCTISTYVPPKFLIAFLGFAVLANSVPLPPLALETTTFVSKLALLTAITGLATRIDVSKVAASGFAPIALLTVNTAFVFLLATSIILFAT